MTRLTEEEEAMLARELGDAIRAAVEASRSNNGRGRAMPDYKPIDYTDNNPQWPKSEEPRELRRTRVELEAERDAYLTIIQDLRERVLEVEGELAAMRSRLSEGYGNR